MKHSNLYVVGATVIPVLLLTQAVQGGIYRRSFQSMSTPVLSGAHRRSSRFAKPMIVVMAVAVAALGFVGELAAILALGDNVDTPGYRLVVECTVIVLFALVAFGVTIEVASSIRVRSGD